MQTLVGIGVILCRESIEQCAIREVMEETALDLRAVSHAGFTDDYFVAESRHYITLFVEAFEADFTGEPQNCEPDKCEAWHWFDWNGLPEPLFPPLKSLKEQQFVPASLR